MGRTQANVRAKARFVRRVESERDDGSMAALFATNHEHSLAYYDAHTATTQLTYYAVRLRMHSELTYYAKHTPSALRKPITRRVPLS